MAEAGPSSRSPPKEDTGSKKKPDVVISPSITKGEVSRVLSKSGVMDLIASILRELYEKDEPDWPENILEYLLHSFIERIPIVKQMELMVKNFEKQIQELDTTEAQMEADLKKSLKQSRRQELMNKAIRSSVMSSNGGQKNEDQKRNSNTTDDETDDDEDPNFGETEQFFDTAPDTEN